VTVPLKTRILLADDHEVVREGLRMVLDSAPDLEVVAQAGDGREAVELALSEDVDLAVLDVTTPTSSARACARSATPTANCSAASRPSSGRDPTGPRPEAGGAGWAV
jgi:DNA-binding NarL/FixJ family response regulator